jgi:O-antigen/teichoic acid export membrane protein
MNKLRRIINNALISFLGQAVTWTSTLLLTIAYGHFLGAFKFGELYLTITFISLMGIPLDAGFSNQIIRSVAQEPEKSLRYFSSILLIKLGLWPILYVLALLVSWLLGYSTEVRVLVGIYGFFLLSNGLASTFASLHYALERTAFPVLGIVLEKGLSALFGILLLKSGAGVQVMALVLIGGSFASAVWQAIWFYRLVGTQFIFDPALIHEIISMNIPFLIYAVLVAGYTNIDTVLLSVMTNSSVVGWYGGATRILDSLNFLPNIVITTIMYPVFSKLSITSDDGLKVAVEKSVNFLLFFSIPIATGLIIAAPNITAFLYHRSDFTHSIPVFQLAAPGLIFVYINFALFTLILSRKQERWVSVMAAIGLIVNLGLNLILIPLYQHSGAAIATSLTEMLMCCIAIVFIPRHLLPLRSLRVAAKALLASLVMAVVILPLHTFHIFVILPVAVLAYFGASVLLETIPREDYQAVYTAILRKVPLAPAAPLTSESIQEQETIASMLIDPITPIPSTPEPFDHSTEPSQVISTHSSSTPKPHFRVSDRTEASFMLSHLADAWLQSELEITEKSPLIRSIHLLPMQPDINSVPETPPPSNDANGLPEDELEITQKRSNIRPVPIQHSLILPEQKEENYERRAETS